jgi:hypothetical protein
MGNRFESFFTGNYEADYRLIDSTAEGDTRYGYEELHITDELIDAIKNGMDIDVAVQDEYTLRIKYGPKEDL